MERFFQISISKVNHHFLTMVPEEAPRILSNKQLFYIKSNERTIHFEPTVPKSKPYCICYSTVQIQKQL